MKYVCFPIITATMAHPKEWAVTELLGEENIQ